MSLKKAVLKSFDPADYQATIQLIGSQRAYLEHIAVARNIPATEMIAGRKVAVIFFDEHNPKEGIVIAVYS